MDKNFRRQADNILSWIYPAVMLVAIYHLWGWYPVFWTSLGLGVLHDVALGWALSAEERAAKDAE